MTNLPGKTESSGSTDIIKIFSSPRPFSDLKVDHIVPAGLSITKILETTGMELMTHLDANVFIDDLWIERSKWSVTVPRHDQIVSIKIVPSNGTDVLRTVALIAVVALSIYAPYATGLWGAGATSLGLFG